MEHYLNPATTKTTAPSTNTNWVRFVKMFLHKKLGATDRGYSYDWRNNKLTDTDQLGRVMKYVYDLAGQLTSTTVAFGTADAATTSTTYDLAGRKLTQTDPRGNATSYAYDAAGRMTSMTDAALNTTTYGYDLKGQRTSMTDAKHRQTTYSYDARGRQLSTTTPDGKIVSKTFDGLGLVLTNTDEENRTTTYGYDLASQLLSVRDALNQLTSFTYDPAGNKLTQVDANTHTTSYAWDNLNRRLSRTLPLSQTESFTYDFEGNTASRKDFNGKTTSFAYDSLNRMLSRTPDASFSAAPITFTYTLTGQRASMTDPSGTTNYTYTNRDQVLSKATPQGTLAYTYDLSGNVSTVLSSNTNGTNVSYAWDANNRLLSVTDNRTSGVTNYSYDATNQLASFTYPNNVAHSYSYDQRDRLTTLALTNAANTTLASYTQTFSDSSHKTSVVELSNRSENYSYDPIYRLITQNITGGAVNGLLNYSLDPVGNRSALTSTLAPLPSQNFAYDSNDRISGDNFDNNGNTLSSSGTNYTFDFEDRLLTASSGVTMLYDGDGNRISKTVAGTTTKYLVDDLNPTRYAQVVEEIVGTSVNAQYLYGLMRISQNRAGTLSYYGYDGHGSVRQLTNASGTVTDTYQFDAFGNLFSWVGSTVNPYMFAGEQFDTDLNLYYMRARWYNQKTGRFVTADKYEGATTDPSSLNGFLFTHNDPVNFVDPSGRITVTLYGPVATAVYSIGVTIKVTCIALDVAEALIIVVNIFQHPGAPLGTPFNGWVSLACKAGALL